MSSRSALKLLGSTTLAAFLLAGGCGSPQQATKMSGGGGVSSAIASLMAARKLTEDDVTAALTTYTPSGRLDEYYLFASGGHGGNLIVMGVPSMRILKYVAVFEPEPWQGYATGDQSTAMLAAGGREGRPLHWGDVHHPALSETGGNYDGQYIFVNDKANARIAVVSLKDFVTRQIVASNLIQSDHGGAFVTPDTDYVIETSQYPAPLGNRYVPIEKFKEEYRGAMIFWKFDRAQGRIVPEQSFAVELPPYMQDLADAGKLLTDGWAFCNSIDTEMARGGNMEGNPPIESGASQSDTDFLHVINWRKAEGLVAAGKATTIAGMKVLPLKTAVDEGVLYFIPESKSPHGCDVTPDGREIVVGGKLDTHCTVFNFEKIKALIDAGRFTGRDPFGVPILSATDSMRGQVEIGLGPLHTQFDGKGFAYTSVFIESKIAKWSLADLKVVDKVACSYNVGHLVAAGGDTVNPDGTYLVAMNKWALDRFNKVGPLLPQNFQLIDVTHGPMRVLYDMPVPLGEPHNAQMIRADKLHPIDIYTPAGTDPITEAKSPNAVEGGKERIERRGDGVHVYMTAVRSHFTPDIIRVKQGDKVHLHVTSLEQALDATHGLAIGDHDINTSIEPGKHVDIDFTADRQGVFPIYCTEFCSALHLEMAGYLLVEPS